MPSPARDPGGERPDAIEVLGVSKSFRHVGLARPTTLKSFLLRDLWARRRGPGRIQALRDVSLRVKKGSTFGIIGTNGSGKSTLLKLLTRILSPDQGEIQIRGRVAALLELGAGFHPELSGRENAVINGIILGLSKRHILEKMQSIIDFAELGDFMEDPVRTYSSGMYVRLGFAVAVHVDPEILLLDEVLSVGDASFERKCLQRMEEFKNAGVTIVLVTHNTELVRTWCDQAMWLDKGSVRMVGGAAEVVASYLGGLGVASGAPAAPGKGLAQKD